MKITITQQVKIEGDNFPHSWRKEYGERIAIPHKGDLLESSLWKDPYEYEVIEVLYDYEEDLCSITVAPYAITIPKSRMEEFNHMANLHGWVTSWKMFEMSRNENNIDEVIE